ncbi:alanine racemase [Motilibacter rhizosphaerae]|uniref:Alanine racemase n=1 Tax=Motilibacter rhizosphaerae TaxID=598652 RepID=A0A4Q7NTK8_9ACTN|nr:alanine racemase [Motilibacter rhizosphaerae]RZS90354.1 alanine racemase [Motilibacter rhizosphaerae]
MSAPPLRSARIDLAALRSNVRALAARAPGAQVMAVVKADAYGHGLVPCGRAAREGGASWLGVALLQEALLLRQSGDTGRLLAWLYGPGEPLLEAAVAADVDLNVSATWALDEVRAAASRAGRPARLHLKIDTGLSRNGAPQADWAALVAAALDAERAGDVRVVGVWTHLAYADVPDHPTVDAQLERFRAAAAVAEEAGAQLEVRHAANSAATLTRPDAAFDLVRPGIAVYGISPVPDLGGPEAYGLRPVMRLSARLALVKRIPAGSGVSYGHEYVTSTETTVGLVPLGYADGIPRHAGGRGPVLAAGEVRPVAGRVCMDQFVLDLGDAAASAGDEVVLFGPGDDGEPSAEDWAVAAGTIAYEVVTRLGPRVERTWVGA